MDKEKERLTQQYGDLGGQIIEVEVDWLPHVNKLGISLVGHKDINIMSIFICAIAQDSLAAVDSSLEVGDQILEVNGRSVYGCSHLNISALLRRSQGKKLRLLIHRSPENISSMAYIVNSLPSQLYLSPRQKLHSRESSPLSSSLTNPRISESLQKQINNIFTCTLPKTSQGIGFTIANGEDGIFVQTITSNTPAAEEGALKVGDLLLSVTTWTNTSTEYSDIQNILLNNEGPIHLTLYRPNSSQSSANPQHLPTDLLRFIHGDNTTSSLPPSQNSTENLPSSVVSPTVAGFEKGRADSILQQLKMTNKPAASNTRQRKLAAWRMGPEHSVNTINPATHPIVANGRETLIEINKANEPLGIGLVGGGGTTLGSLVISELYEKGAALLDGRLQPGDILLEINHLDVSRFSVSEAHHLLCTCTGKVNLLVRRLPAAIKESNYESSIISEVNDRLHVNTNGKKAESWWSHWREEDWLQIFTVELFRKPGKGLGISIIGRQCGNEFISPSNVPPGLQAVFVKEMLRGGTADLDGRIRPGDVILEINGKDVRNMSQLQVAALLKSCIGKVHLLLGRLIPSDVSNEFQLNLIQKIGRQAFECRNEDVLGKDAAGQRRSLV